MKSQSSSLIAVLLLSLVTVGFVLPAKSLAAPKFRLCLNQDSGKLVVRKKCKKKLNEVELTGETLAMLSPASTGPKGDSGPQGATGPTGPQGPVGPAGPIGPQGAKGDSGAQGETGPQGAQGAQGPQGLVGVSNHSSATGQQSTVFTGFQAKGLSVTCSNGRKVMGGGCSSATSSIAVTSSFPSQNDTAWACIFRNQTNSTISNVTISANAVCANVD